MPLGLVAAAQSTARRFRGWTSGRFLRRIHRATHRLPVELRAVDSGRSLVLAPHMDDEVIGAGGTLTRLRAAGAPVAVLFTTDSGGTAGGSMTEIRTREARAVAERFGFEVLCVCDYPDGRLSLHEPALARDVAAAIDGWKPDRVFVPFPGDHHRDHQATAAALAEALDEVRWDGEVWCYEVWSALWPNVCVDVTATADAKREAIGLYPSQLAGMDYVEAALGLNRYRGLRVRVPYAEAFHVASPAAYKRLAAALQAV